MCFGGMYPNSVGLKIAELKRGDQIIILYGEGYPQVQKDTVDIIWKVADYSALTAGGIMLNCHTISDVIRTGGHFEDFLVSAEAKSIWEEIREGLDEGSFPSEPE